MTRNTPTEWGSDGDALQSLQTQALLAFLDAHQDEAPSDLHIHTTQSDGSDTFSQVLEQAKQNNLAYVAFTNHDATNGLDEARELGKAYGVGVIGGIEISAWDGSAGHKVHVLGYGLSSDSPAIASLCGPTLQARHAQSYWAVDQLLDAGYAVDEARLRSLYADSGVLYKQHIMQVLCPHPFSSAEYQNLYKTLFKGEGICAGDISYVDVHDAVRAITEDGGVAVLAHPGQQDNYYLVPGLVQCGLSGIEKYHVDHGPSDWKKCDELAETYNLIRTAGSDYHGAFGHATSLRKGAARAAGAIT